MWVLLKTTRTLWCGGCGGSGVWRGWRRWIYVGDVVAAAGVAVVMVARCGREGDDGDECEGGGGGVELVTRMAAGVWGSDDGDGHEGGVMVAAVGRQPEEVEARGGEWIWGSGRSGHEDNIWFRPERSPENFSGGGGMVAGGKGGRKFWRRWRRKMMFVCVLYFV
ncbi:hypothetical protein Tco_0123291 [Tanacetum coccineum]